MAITTPVALRHLLHGFQRQEEQEHAQDDDANIGSSLSQHLKLELGETSDLPSLSAEIRHSRNTVNCGRIKHLVIGSEHDLVKRYMSEPHWSSASVVQDIDDLFEALTEHPTLMAGVETLHLQDLGITLGPSGPRFPVKLLSQLLLATTRKYIINAATAEEEEEAEGQQSLSSSSHLKRLTLSVRLTGTASDFEEFSRSLRALTSLEEVVWEEWCFPSHDGVDRYHLGMYDTITDNTLAVLIDFNSILQALASLPGVEKVCIKAMTAGGSSHCRNPRAPLGWLNSDTLVGLLSNVKSLKHVELVHFQFSNQTIHDMARALRQGTSDSTPLETFSLDLSQTSPTAAKAFFDAVSVTRGLKVFQIWASTGVDWVKDKCLVHLAETLQHNACLTNLSVVSHARTLHEAIVQNVTVVDDRIAEAFCRAMESNRTLQKLELDDYFDNTFSDSDNEDGDDEESSLCVCESTTSLTNSQPHPAAIHTTLSRSNKVALMLRFYLNMNTTRARHQLVLGENASMICHQPTEWMESLAAITTDHYFHPIQLDMVYYFLRLNPALCISHDEMASLAMIRRAIAS